MRGPAGVGMLAGVMRDLAGLSVVTSLFTRASSLA